MNMQYSSSRDAQETKRLESVCSKEKMIFSSYPKTNSASLLAPTCSYIHIHVVLPCAFNSTPSEMD